MAFCNWLLSLSIMLSMFTHIMTGISTSYFNFPMCRPHFIYLSNNGHLGCFHFLTIIDYPAMNVHVIRLFGGLTWVFIPRINYWVIW